MNAPIVLTEEKYHKEVAPDHRSGLQVIETGISNPPIPVTTELAQVKASRRRWIWVTGAVAVVAVILIIVLSVVLTRKHTSSSHDHATAPQSKPRPTGVASSSGLTATAWTENQGYKIGLVYQDESGYLQALTYDSGTSVWSTTASNFTRAKMASPLALAKVGHVNSADIQAQLFHLDDQGYIQQWTWSTNALQQGQAGGINNNKILAHYTSTLSAYWPFLIYTDVDLELHELQYTDNGMWTDRLVNETMSDGGAVSVIPATQKISTMDIFFQRSQNQELIEYMQNTTNQSVYTNTSMLTHPIPVNSSIASFSLPNPQDPRRLNTYFLCQDWNADINFRLREDDSGWKAIFIPDAFKGADNGTSLACITMYTYFDDFMKQGVDVPRCYFLAGGAIREVELDVGTAQWKLIGDIELG